MSPNLQYDSHPVSSRISFSSPVVPGNTRNELLDCEPTPIFQTSTNLRTPADYDLAYEDLFFFSQDGLMLKGWWIPAKTVRHVNE